jgi:transcriptional regulator with XRE-family HTH domain
MGRPRSARQKRQKMADTMRTDGATWTQIAEEIADREKVNMRVAHRLAHDWSQEEVARLWSIRWPNESRTGWTISMWERWPDGGRQPSLETLGQLALLYRADVAALICDMHKYSQLDENDGSRTVTQVTYEPPPPNLQQEDDDMDRRRLITTATAAGAVAAVNALGIPTPAAAELRPVSRGQAQMIRDAITQIEADDAVLGGAAVVDTATELHDRVDGWLANRTYTPNAAEELRSLLGELLQWRGWLAYDANDIATARTLTEKTIVHARMTEDGPLEAQAMNTLVQVNRRQDRKVAALDAAEAGSRAARGWATPRVDALFHFRAAQAYARLGEEAPFAREVAAGRRQLDRGPSDSDPLFSLFLNEQEAAHMEGVCLLELGKTGRAVERFRLAAASPVDGRPRNDANYTAWLAHAASANHDIEEASIAGSKALDLLAGVDSPRTMRLLTQLRTTVEPHRRSVPAADAFAASYDQTA